MMKWQLHNIFGECVYVVIVHEFAQILLLKSNLHVLQTRVSLQTCWAVVSY